MIIERASKTSWREGKKLNSLLAAITMETVEGSFSVTSCFLKELGNDKQALLLSRKSLWEGIPRD